LEQVYLSAWLAFFLRKTICVLSVGNREAVGGLAESGQKSKGRLLNRKENNL